VISFGRLLSAYGREMSYWGCLVAKFLVCDEVAQTSGSGVNFVFSHYYLPALLGQAVRICYSSTVKS